MVSKIAAASHFYGNHTNYTHLAVFMCTFPSGHLQCIFAQLVQLT